MAFSIALHTTLFVRVYIADFTRGLTSVYRRRGLKSRSTLAMFALIIIPFTLATLNWAAWMADVVIQIRSVLVQNIGMDLSEKFALTNAARVKPELIQAFVGDYPLVSYPQFPIKLAAI